MTATLPRESLACSLCRAPLSGGKDTFGEHDWPLCHSCKWDDYDLRRDYLSGIDGLGCCEIGKVMQLVQHGYRLSCPSDFTPPGSLCCPECGGELYVEVQEWDELTGFPTIAGVLVGCLSESRMNAVHRAAEIALWGVGHRFWQSDWQPTINNVVNWVTRECFRRLREKAEAAR
jgi:hypothetical protein